ncbi:MAG TPA: DUF4260 domain-containing protein [Microvirga sp.]|jgi:hypothetical protein|nr:DUF4260 domain-containing protein [Microvirga sp.]
MEHRPAVAGSPRVLLRLEGSALFVAATVAYAFVGESWWFYALAFFAPDLSFAAYRAGPRVGAAAYNAVHTTVLPAVLALVGFVLDASILLALASILAAHVGFDRMLGYGLKYPTAFSDTHLGRIGRPAGAAT